MVKYVSKPVEVEAIQLLRTRESIIACLEFMGVQTDPPVPARCFKRGINVITADGNKLASYGDYIVKLPDGTYMPYSQEVFKEIFEESGDGQ